MAMSKKDYQALARAIYEATDTLDPSGDGTRVFDAVVKSVSDALAADNPRFDPARFVEACETGTCKGMPKAKAS